ncbi:hypothetical protein [Geminicoccus roseus]|uniref:hypothetical protein n=1 Tax=Geminicoccus roseus TaxID=404900 RepID=UPI000486F7D0|nr:hypothetical protein [Geminicoccus roseus]
MTEVLRPGDLHRITDEGETRKMEELHARMQKAEQQQREMHDAFMQWDKVRPNAMELVMRAVRNAAEQGMTEIKVMQFPSSYCTDGGRAINNFEEGWQATLQGRAKTAMEFYKEHLQPLGYKARVEVLSFPGGMPGDIGLFLSW